MYMTDLIDIIRGTVAEFIAADDFDAEGHHHHGALHRAYADECAADFAAAVYHHHPRSADRCATEEAEE